MMNYYWRQISNKLWAYERDMTDNFSWCALSHHGLIDTEWSLKIWNQHAIIHEMIWTANEPEEQIKQKAKIYFDRYLKLAAFM